MVYLPFVKMDTITPTMVVIRAPINGYRMYDKVYNFSGKSLEIKIQAEILNDQQ